MSRKNKEAKAPAASLAHWTAPVGVALAVAGTALLFSRDFALAFFFPKLIVLCAGVWLASAGLAASAYRPFRTQLDAPLAALLLVMALSTAASTDRWLSLLGAEDHMFGLWVTAVLASVYWLAVRSAPGRETILLKTALVAYGLAGFYAVLQAAGLEPFAGMPVLANGRAYSTLGSPVALGELMTLALPLALYWIRARSGEAVGWACLAAIVGGLLASISRGAWLSSAVVCGIYLACEPGRPSLWKNPRRLALSGLAVLVLLAASAVTLKRRPVSAGDGGRTLIWRSAWELFKERPTLGWGVNTFALTSRLKRTAEAVRLSSVREIPGHAHDDFLHALATAGVLGLGAYLWLCAALVLAALRAVRDPERPWALALACGLLGLFLNMKVNPVPLEALAGAAFFAALLADRSSAALSGRRGSLPALAAATASLLLVGRMAAAEIAKSSAERFAAGGRYDLAARESARAVRDNPWEMSYRLDYINALAALSSRLAPPSARNEELLETALGTAREGLRLHPRHPDAHYGEGIVLLNLAYLHLSLTGALGDLEPARQSLDRSLSLDATYVPTLQARRVVAEGLADAKTAAEMTRRILLIQDAAAPMKERIQGTGADDSFTRP